MTPLRIAVIKPDWGVVGGFERVLTQVTDHLTTRGHSIVPVRFDAWRADRRPFGHHVADASWERHPDLFSYLSLVEEARRVRLDGTADLVLSTQPPSFVVDHPRHLALFYHHQRIFYDLSEVALAAGIVGDEAIHTVAVEAVRRIDDRALARVTHMLCGSETVRARIEHYHGRVRGTEVFHAGPISERVGEPTADRLPFALCISRHDFPKRTELFVHALHLLNGVRGICVGTGGRLGHVRRLDRHLTDEGAPDVLDPTATWLNQAPWIDPAALPAATGPLRFISRAPAVGLQRLLHSASCVVAPALLEDFGLTAIEAMSYGVPVVTCTDSGHLTELVEDDVTGLVVAPTGRAIADAVARLITDHELRHRLGEAGRERAREFTWSRALAELDAAVEATLS